MVKEVAKCALCMLHCNLFKTMLWIRSLAYRLDWFVRLTVDW